MEQQWCVFEDRQSLGLLFFPYYGSSYGQEKAWKRREDFSLLNYAFQAELEPLECGHGLLASVLLLK
jgi:hypothetical protein